MSSGYVKPGDPITAYVRYVSAATGLGLAGIAVKVAVNRGASNLVSVASATAATEVDATNQPGLYSYTYSGDTTTLGQYIFAFTTTDLTVSARSWTVITEVGYIPANTVQVEGADASNAINAEVVDALATDTYAEPGQGAPAATASLAAKINYLFKAWRNKSTQTSTTHSLFADDASTVDQKATTSDDGTTFTRGEIVSGP